MDPKKSETKGDSGTPHGPKLVENLKRTLFDITDTSGKALTSREVRNSFVELIDAVCGAVGRPNIGTLIGSTVELLVHACSSPDQDIRSAASENLRKLIKALMSTHLSRLQQDLFHELKKNGSARSLCVALDCFAALFPRTRPAKCSYFAQALLPVLVRLTGRTEEGVLDTLQESVSKILPTMIPFVSTTNIKMLMQSLLNRLSTGSPSYRRMAATALLSITTHSHNTVEWLITKLLDLGCGTTATSELVQGVLLTLQQIFSMMSDTKPPISVVMQAYSFTVSCLLYRDANTSISALEVLNQLLSSASAELAAWVTEQQPDAQVAIDFWAESLEPAMGDTASDTHSLGEGLEDSYFSSEERLAETPDSRDDPASRPRQSTPEQTLSPSTVTVKSCLALEDGPLVPLLSLVQYLMDCVLSNSRVSAQSLGLACIAAAVEILPTTLPSLTPVEAFYTAHDPKLRSRTVKLLAAVLASQLRLHRGDLASCSPVVSQAFTQLCCMLKDSTPVVLKAACEALQYCLPPLTQSSEPQRVTTIIELLLPLRESAYWLTKVELLQTLSCLYFTDLALTDATLPPVVLNGVVFKLLGDTDHRVRTAACECLVSMAPTLQLSGEPLLASAQWQACQLFSHLHSSTTQLSLAGIADSMAKLRPLTPMGLEHMLWFLLGNVSSSVNLTLQRGCLEALHTLALHYPPPSLPRLWGCTQSPCSALAILQQLLNSRLGWGVQGQCELLSLMGSVFFACALTHMDAGSQLVGQAWGALSEPTLALAATHLLGYTVKLLCLLVHVIEHREPETKDSKRIQVPTVSPRKPVISDAPSPGKPKPQLLQIELQKPPLTPKDGLGQFSSIGHFLKLYDACKSAYTNYEVSLSAVGEDKFSKLLQICHNVLASILEIALADDVGKYVEELLSYLNLSAKVDPTGALLCVQQLLNALFGLNTVAQHTHVYSPYVSSLPYDISAALSVYSPSSSQSLYAVTVTQPLTLMTTWLQAPSHPVPSSPAELSTKSKFKPRHSLLPIKKALVVKPMNPVSSIKDYIGYFEPLVVHSLHQFSYTSSMLLQQRVLFLLVQLLRLKVRYELLDCNHSFLESVLKLVSLMESGVVRGGEKLVPHLFQFMVLLAYDQSKLLTVPQVIQKCDGVMASGHSVTTFAIPALQPLVLNLFVKPSRETSDLETQREVVLNMLLRLVDHPRVISLLIHVLECYRKNKKQWEQVSNQIYAALLPHIGKLHLLLDSSHALASLYHLFASMDPGVISIEALFTALLKQHQLKSLEQLLCWLGVFSTVLELMITSFPEQSLLKGISTLQFCVPGMSCAAAQVEAQQSLSETDKATQLAVFMHGALYLASAVLNQLFLQRSSETCGLLPALIGNILLLMQTLTEGSYPALTSALNALSFPLFVTTSFIQLGCKYPLLTLHYLVLQNDANKCEMISALLSPAKHPGSTNSRLLQNALLLVLCEKLSVGAGPNSEYSKVVASSPVLLQHCHVPAVQSCIRSIQSENVLQKAMMAVLKSTDTSSPFQCLQAARLASCIPSPESLAYLCSHLATHPLSAVSSYAEAVAISIIDGGSFILSSEEAEQLLNTVKLPDGSKCCELSKKLGYLCGQSQLARDHEDGHSKGDMEIAAAEWLIKKVRQFCQRRGASDECVRVLSRLGNEHIRETMENHSFPMGLLDSCITHGVLLSLNKDTSGTESFQMALHPLLKCSVQCLLGAVSADPSDLGLVRPVTRLLAARQQLPNAITFESSVALSVGTLAKTSLHAACGSDDLLAVQSAVDCCTLALHTPETRKSMSEEMICDIIADFLQIIKTTYPASAIAGQETINTEHQKIEPLEQAKKNLYSMVQVVLSCPSNSARTLQCSLESLALGLSRHPLFHGFVVMPPALMGEGKVSEKVLDQALMDSEILRQYMQHCNPIGWLSRSQFEERWMQLLGVVNQPPPQVESIPEEYQAYIVNLCSGVLAVTSLLLGTTLRPNLGDPTSSVSMHTPRYNEMNFLSSVPGRKLAHLRRLIELQLILQCGVQPNLYSHYQCPLLHHVTSPQYPPIYIRNVERALGEDLLGPGQMSLNSLWPVMLKSATSSGHITDSTEIDVKSCILSLLDLYAHWLSQPIHTLLLQHVLSSVVMLSDLFAMSSQFDWMLQKFFEVFEHHPPEDMGTISCTVFGILKAAAVLKMEGPDAEKVSKVVEKSLSSDAALIVKKSCIQGLLYIVEDGNSSIIPECASIVAKHIVNHLQTFQRFTDSHNMAVWSLAVSLTMNHSHYIDSLFSGQLLEVVVPILLHANTSTVLYQSLTSGLEFLIINFSLSSDERKLVANTAANRFLKCDQSKSLPALALLVVCMYTGEEADVMSGVANPPSNPMENALEAREHVNNLMERIRHGPLVDVKYLVDVLPPIIVDFLSPMEVLQTVVTEFLSPHQTRPTLAATVMAECFGMLLQQGHRSIVTEWTLLSLDSFVQQEPQTKAVWSISCLLTAASSDEIVNSLFTLVCHWETLTSSEALSLLCIAARDFYGMLEHQQGQFLGKFANSRYPALMKVAELCA